ncbi:MAG: outer membrane beta-barrel protein [bacterium]|jgi:hypothetical protein
MKKLIGIIVLFLAFSAAAQKKSEKATEPKPKKDYSKLNLSKRTSDHLLLQLGLAKWGNADEMNIRGYSKTFNAYFLFDFPFKSNPKFSTALGTGIGTDNIFFKKTNVNIIGGNGVTITPDNNIQYSKSKLSSSYLEIPFELRYSTKPENMNKGWKFAVGAKVGLLIDSKVKTKLDAVSGDVGGYMLKIKDKRYFNSTRFVGTARVGMGNFSLFGTYTLTSMFKEGLGPLVRPYSIGITLSGL